MGVFVEYGKGGHWHVWWTCDTKQTHQSCDFSVSARAASGNVTNLDASELAGGFVTSATTSRVDAKSTTTTEVHGIRFDTNPGAIITGDMVKLYEKCPVCDRVGPVLAPEVRRASGEEVRGCAEEMRRLIDEQTPELMHDLVCTPDMSRMPLMLLEKDD